MAKLATAPLPGDGPIGESWLLSDRDDYCSQVANGLLKGKTISQLMQQSSEQLLGELAGRFRRFPLLLKFLDAHDMLSVQVHPSDLQTDYLPPGEQGKTEAWVVLEVGPKGTVYAGLKDNTTAEDLRQAIANGTLVENLDSFIPKPGDGIFLQAGTVHSMGDLVVFEVQENSDVTFRLYDWDRVDAKTGQRRPLQVEQALACIDYSDSAAGPVAPVVEEVAPVLRERLVRCEQFCLWRIHGESPFMVGETGMPRVLVCIEGSGKLAHDGTDYTLNKGDIMLLPAIVGECRYETLDVTTLLEISLT